VGKLHVNRDLLARTFSEHDLHFGVVHEAVDLVVGVSLPAKCTLLAVLACR